MEEICSDCTEIYLYAEDMYNNGDGMLSEARKGNSSSPSLSPPSFKRRKPQKATASPSKPRNFKAVTFSVPPSNWLGQSLELTSTPTAGTPVTTLLV